MSTTPISIAGIVTDLCRRSGIPSAQVDVSQLSALKPNRNLLGHLFERRSNGAMGIRTLMENFFFNGAETDGKLRFAPRGVQPSIVQHAVTGTLFTTCSLTITDPQEGSVILAIENADGLAAISDSQGLTWNALFHDPLRSGLGIWYAISNGQTTTITFIGSGSFGNAHIDAYAMEIQDCPIPAAPATGSWTGTTIGSLAAPFGCTTFSFVTQTTSSGFIALLSIPNFPSTQGLFIGFYAAPSGSNLFPGSRGPGWTVLDSGAWSLVAVMQSGFTIPEDDLGLIEDKAKLEEHDSDPQDLPLVVNTLYADPALDYQQGHQQKQRNARIVQSRRKQITSVPMTLTADQARAISEVALYLQWLERQGYTMNLWRAYFLLLDPSDIVNFIYESLTFRMRIIETTIGKGRATALAGVASDPKNFHSLIAGGLKANFAPQPIQLAGQTILFLWDIPLLDDADANSGGTGFYFSMTSQAPTWAGGVLYNSTDDTNFNPESADAVPAAYGYARTALPAPRSPWTWDAQNSLTIDMQVGSLAGDTMLNVLNGSNRALLGNASGGFEVVHYVNAPQNMDGSFTISLLLRGRRGTEAACGGHAIGDLFIPLPSGTTRVALPLAALKQLRYYRGVTVAQDITTASDETMTLAGNDLKPYAPAHLGGTVAGSGDITLTWIRRTRVGGEWQSGPGSDQVPLSEDSEAYDVEILNGLTVVRTVTVPTPTFVYTAATQTDDFGSAQASVNFNVYQKSAQVGRGFKAAGTAPTPGGWPVPAPAVFPTIAGVPVDPASLSSPTDGEVLQFNGTNGTLELVAGLNRTEIALAPGAAGNFTVAHGLGATPKLVLIQMTSGGEIWFQTARYDGANLYLVASDAGITGFAECYT